MKLLGLESSAKSASAALMEDGRLLARTFQNTGLTHSATLLPMVDAMIQNSGLTLDAIDAVAVAVGPGSFTGLRIGVSAAKGIAWARQLPCAGVSTLEAMAWNLAHLQDTVILCAMDARRSQIYHARFLAGGGTLRRLCGDQAVALSCVAQALKQETRPMVVVGDGAALCRDYLADAGIPCALAPEHLRMQDAVGVCVCAGEMAAEGRLTDAAGLQPVYLRLSQAERERLARQEAEKEKEEERAENKIQRKKGSAV